MERVVIVTGGAKGIGKCIVEEFRKTGALVHVIDKEPGDWFVGDIAEPQVLERFVGEVVAREGHVDVLVNNALPLFKGIDACSYEEFLYAQKVGIRPCSRTASSVSPAPMLPCHAEVSSRLT